MNNKKQITEKEIISKQLHIGHKHISLHFSNKNIVEKYFLKKKNIFVSLFKKDIIKNSLEDCINNFVNIKNLKDKHILFLINKKFEDRIYHDYISKFSNVSILSSKLNGLINNLDTISKNLFEKYYNKKIELSTYLKNKNLKNYDSSILLNFFKKDKRKMFQFIRWERKLKYFINKPIDIVICLDSDNFDKYIRNNLLDRKLDVFFLCDTNNNSIFINKKINIFFSNNDFYFSNLFIIKKFLSNIE